MKMIMIDTEKTGKKIKEMCLEKGLKVKDVQRELGLKTPQAVYKWFSGKTKTIPSIDNLVMLGILLECHIEEMIDFKEIENN